MPLAPAAQQAWRTLADALRRFEAPRQEAAAPAFLPTAARLGEAARPQGVRLSTGCRPLDERLPEGGVRPGSLVDWISPVRGGGAGTFAWNCAWRACGRARWLVVVDRSDVVDRSNFDERLMGVNNASFYDSFFNPPGGGGDPSRWLVARPADDSQAHWALHQALSCPAVGAVLGWEWNFDENAWRRLQRAAERSGALGVFVGGPAARRSGAWADHRFRVEPRPAAAERRLSWEEKILLEKVPLKDDACGSWREGAAAGDARRFRIEILRCRGRAAQPGLEVERRYGADFMRPFPPLAAAAAPRRAAGA